MLAIKLRFHAVTLTFDHEAWTFVEHRVSRVQTLYKIWAKSNDPRRSYGCFSMLFPSNIRGYSFVREGFQGGEHGANCAKFGGVMRPSKTHVYFRFPTCFSALKSDPLKAIFCTFLPSPCKNQGRDGDILESIFRQISYAPGHFYVSDMLLRFETRALHKSRPDLAFLTPPPVKIREEMGEMFEWIVPKWYKGVKFSSVQHRAKTVIYFWRGVARPYGRSEVRCQKK